MNTKNTTQKKKIHKLDYINIRIFCSSKDTIKSCKDKSLSERRYSQYIYQRGHLQSMKRYLHISKKKTDNLILKTGQKT